MRFTNPKELTEFGIKIGIIALLGLTIGGQVVNVSTLDVVDGRTIELQNQVDHLELVQEELKLAQAQMELELAEIKEQVK